MSSNEFLTACSKSALEINEAGAFQGMGTPVDLTSVGMRDLIVFLCLRTWFLPFDHGNRCGAHVVYFVWKCSRMLLGALGIFCCIGLTVQQYH